MSLELLSVVKNLRSMIIVKNVLNDLGQSFHSRETARGITPLPQRDLEAVKHRPRSLSVD